MSATRAAAALMVFDADTRAAVESLNAANWYEADAEQKRQAAIRDLAGTWTLGLAARSAGVDEAAVLVAFARDWLGYVSRLQASAAVRKALDGMKLEDEAE